MYMELERAPARRLSARVSDQNHLFREPYSVFIYNLTSFSPSPYSYDILILVCKYITPIYPANDHMPNVH